MTCRIAVPLLVSRLMLLVAPLLIAGCATVYEGKLNPALFSRSEPPTDGRATAKIAVVVDAALLQSNYEHRKRLPLLALPTGQIVGAAAVAALSDELGQSVVQYPSLSTAKAVMGPAAQLTLVTPGPLVFELRDEYFVLPYPLPPIPVHTRQEVRLIVDWQVQDADGRLLWNKRYDSGEVKLPYRSTADHDLADGDLWLRLAHQVAYTLMRKAAEDVRNWLETERLRERVL